MADFTTDVTSMRTATSSVKLIGTTNTITRSVKSTNIDMSGLTKEEVLAACAKPDPSTEDFIMQQTMYRIKEPARSLDFYTKILGMRLLHQFHFDSMKFSLYFMGYEKEEEIPKEEKERICWCFTRRGTIELTHNWGTESDPEQSYHNGNSEPRGFGHIGISVPDVEKACKRFEELGVEFIKKPDEGKMKGLAFIKDPDGYWIEILNSENAANMPKM